MALDWKFCSLTFPDKRIGMKALNEFGQSLPKIGAEARKYIYCQYLIRVINEYFRYPKTITYVSDEFTAKLSNKYILYM